MISEKKIVQNAECFCGRKKVKKSDVPVGMIRVFPNCGEVSFLSIILFPTVWETTRISSPFYIPHRYCSGFNHDMRHIAIESCSYPKSPNVFVGGKK
jgi:hypothetical protein